MFHARLAAVVHGAEWVLLVTAGFAAGTVNAVAGGGSLLSFPALMLVGYPAVVANVTNSIALLPGFAGGSLAYRDELVGQRKRIVVFGALLAVGGLLGAVLLLVGPDELFRSLAPWLILLACITLASRPLLRARGERQAQWVLWLLIFVGGIYGGYFGAGLGIMLLAMLGSFLPDGLHRINALRGVLSLIVALAQAVVVALFGPVAWGAGLAMAAASWFGGHVGVGVVRRVDERLLRWGIVSYGVVVAVVLLVT